MKNLIYILSLLLALVSCKEVIELDLPFNDQKLVVDGLITNQNKQHTIKLAYTEKYNFKYQTSNSVMAGNATVIVKDDIGSIDTLIETSTGIYKTDTTIFVGTIGRTYTLEIQTLDGQTWLSDPETMVAVPPIDSIYFARDVNDVSVDNPDYYKYIVYTNWQDPVNVENNYLRNIEYKWNNEWKENISWNWVFNDKYIDGKYIQKSLLLEDYGAYLFFVKLNQYSLTKKAFQFWSLVHEQTQIAGNDVVNSSVPLFGNVYNKDNPNNRTLGYFQVSAHHSKTVYIDK